MFNGVHLGYDEDREERKVENVSNVIADLINVCLRPAQTRGSDLTSGLTMLWAKDVARVCLVTSGSISPH